MQLAQVSCWQLANWLVQMPKSVGLTMSSLGRCRAGPFAHGWTGPVAHGWNRTEFDPPDAGPGDAVLPPGRSTRPGPARPTQRAPRAWPGHPLPRTTHDRTGPGGRYQALGEAAVSAI